MLPYKSVVSRVGFGIVIVRPDTGQEDGGDAVIVVARAQGVFGFAEPTSIRFQVGRDVAMVAPMAGWMRFRGCAWRECAGMSAAMLLSSAAVLMSSALELQDAQLWLASNQHVLM